MWHSVCKNLRKGSKEIFHYSVIIPVFNDQEKLLRAVESAINQTLKPSEIIVVDDASLVEVSRSLEKFPVKVFRQDENRGSFQARLVGVDGSKSPYIFFLDSDDFWDPNHAEVHAMIWSRAINTNTAQVGTILRPQVDKSLSDAIDSKNRKLINKGQRYVGITELLSNNPFYNSASSFERNSLVKSFASVRTNQSKSYCEDLLISTQIFALGRRVLMNPVETGEYNLSGNRKSDQHFKVLFSVNEIQREALNNQETSNIKVRIAIVVGMALFRLRWLNELFKIHPSYTKLLVSIETEIPQTEKKQWLHLVKKRPIYLFIKVFFQSKNIARVKLR